MDQEPWEFEPTELRKDADGSHRKLGNQRDLGRLAEPVPGVPSGAAVLRRTWLSIVSEKSGDAGIREYREQGRLMPPISDDTAAELVRKVGLPKFVMTEERAISAAQVYPPYRERVDGWSDAEYPPPAAKKDHAGERTQRLRSIH